MDYSRRRSVPWTGLHSGRSFDRRWGVSVRPAAQPPTAAFDQVTCSLERKRPSKRFERPSSRSRRGWGRSQPGQYSLVGPTPRRNLHPCRTSDRLDPPCRILVVDRRSLLLVGPYAVSDGVRPTTRPPHPVVGWLWSRCVGVAPSPPSQALLVVPLSSIKRRERGVRSQGRLCTAPKERKGKRGRGKRRETKRREEFLPRYRFTFCFSITRSPFCLAQAISSRCKRTRRCLSFVE